MSKCQTMEVYVCKKDGEIVYIGKGRKDRHKHCNSGVSHVFELNEIRFTEGADVLETEVVKYFKTDKEACEYEIFLIGKYNPKFNKTYTTKTKTENMTEARKLKSSMKAHIMDVRSKNLRNVYESYYALVDEFLGHFGCNFHNKGDLKIYGTCFYKGLGLKSLANLSRYLRGDGVYAKDSYLAIFYEYVYNAYKLDLKQFLTGRVEKDDE